MYIRKYTKLKNPALQDGIFTLLLYFGVYLTNLNHNSGLKCFFNNQIQYIYNRYCCVLIRCVIIIIIIHQYSIYLDYIINYCSLLLSLNNFIKLIVIFITYNFLTFTLYVLQLLIPEVLVLFVFQVLTLLLCFHNVIMLVITYSLIKKIHFIWVFHHISIVVLTFIYCSKHRSLSRLTAHFNFGFFSFHFLF